jgi:hypothetical protein
MTYALGRGMQAYDKRAMDQIQRNVTSDGYHFQTLIHEVVTSLPFQSRRGEQPLHPTTVTAEKSKELAPK